MSLVTEILDRLTGIATVNARLEETAGRVEKMAAWMLDHEKRITRLEARTGGDSQSPSGKKALPKR